MQDLLLLIQKNIDKLRFIGSGWSYNVDLKNSCIASDQYTLVSAIIYGEGSIHDSVRVRVQYYVHPHLASQQYQGRCKKFKNIERAILYVWEFPERYRLCRDCCRLVKKDQECEACIFYKSFMIHKKKSEQCGICQEECFRIALECKHFFHKSCLVKMSPLDMKCPLCRHPVSEEVVSNLFDDDDMNDDDEDDDHDSILDRGRGRSRGHPRDYRSDDDNDDNQEESSSS
jgi:hypothetical protein